MSPLTFSRHLLSLLVLVFMLVGAGCKGNFATEASSVVSGCSLVSGTPWVPNLAGVSSANHDALATVSETVITATGPLTGLAQAAPASQEIQVSFTVPEDLGAAGSITLTAEVTDFPSGLSGGAFPALVYLSDGTNDFINLVRGSGACGTDGYFTCTSSECATNASCSVSWPSAYDNRHRWEQHQVPVFGNVSVNTFPTCNWAGGTTTTAGDPACAFNTNFFSGGKLRTGTYTARYVLLADRYAKALDGYNAGLKVTVSRKKDPNGAGGAIDVNVILVGTTNIKAGRSEHGKRNLDTLLSQVNEHFSQATVGVRLGTVQVYEWSCENGGDAYANVDVNNLGKMFETGSASLTGAGTRALNLFLVDSITWSEPGTILGVAGGIGGPLKIGTATSGLAFTSFGKLASYNLGCSTTPCPPETWEHEFAEMAITISHEMGHFLGLNHPSELAGTSHDMVRDTPVCTKTSSGKITVSSCLQDTNTYPVTSLRCSNTCSGYNSEAGTFCPDAQECQFNHMMWWSSKNFMNGAGDGNLFSSQSGGIINYNPFVQ